MLIENGILSFCLFILLMGLSRQEYWSGLPFPSPVDHILSDLSTMTRQSWIALQAWLGFIELDKAVVLVWLDWLVFFEYGFSVSALWCPLVTPTILLGFLLLWAWGISSRLLQQRTAAAPYLGWGVSPYHCCSWPSTWDSSSRPSYACADTTPQVAPAGRCHWPLTWGVSSRLLPLTLGLVRRLAATSRQKYMEELYKKDLHDPDNHDDVITSL